MGKIERHESALGKSAGSLKRLLRSYSRNQSDPLAADENPGPLPRWSALIWVPLIAFGVIFWVYAMVFLWRLASSLITAS
ncbi:MAG: hypothetical protein AAF668_16125 [Pseudomonadota bacterium]